MHLSFLHVFLWLHSLFLFKWSEVTQSCPTLCDPMDCSLPGFSVHGIFQARVLEWGAVSLSNSLLSGCAYLFVYWKTSWLLPSWGTSNKVGSMYRFWGGCKLLLGFPSGSVVKNPPAKQEAQEMLVQSVGLEDPLKEEVATHSSILAWRISWTEKPGGLQSLGSQKN